MSLKGIEPVLIKGLEEIKSRGSEKGDENVIRAIVHPSKGLGPRYLLQGHGDRAFLRMNSNSYLGLSLHPEVLAAEEKASVCFGAGPGAVRFISGTFSPHRELEDSLASFHGRDSSMIFSAAYAAVMGVLPQLISRDTLVISDALNHNCIINAIRLSHPGGKEIYKHLDMAELSGILKKGSEQYRRAIVVTDGVFSMRGDHAPLDRLVDICKGHEGGYEEGVITVVDDSHGVGAFGKSGRGTEEVSGDRVDILLATLGKAFGVNGGYVVGSKVLVDYLRETSPFYIYSNPITPSEAAAALKAVEIADSDEGARRLNILRGLSDRLREDLARVGFETLGGEHPIVPLMVRDTEKTSALVEHLFNSGILATGLNYPVVPKGDEEIRFQINADHSEMDIDYLISALEGFK